MIRHGTFQFGLGTIFIALTSLATFFAVQANNLRAERLETAALKQLQSRGFTTFHDDEGAYVVPGQPQALWCGTGLREVYAATHGPLALTEQDVQLLGYVRALRSLELTGISAPVELVAAIRSRHPECSISQ